MELKVVNQNIARELKKYGFNWPCDSYFDNDGSVNIQSVSQMVKREDWNNIDGCFSLPEQALAVKWLRVVKIYI